MTVLAVALAQRAAHLAGERPPPTEVAQLERLILTVPPVTLQDVSAKVRLARELASLKRPEEAVLIALDGAAQYLDRIAPLDCTTGKRRR